MSKPGLLAVPVSNLGGLRARLRRRRRPTPGMGYYSRMRLFWTGIALLALAIVVAVIGLDPFSVRWAKRLDGTTEAFFRFITDFGKSEWVLIPSGVLGLALLCANWTRVSRRVAAAWIEVGELLGFFFFTVAAAGIVTNFVKWTVGRARPTLFKEEGYLSFEPLFSFGYKYVSFPSGHTTTVAAAFMACALIFRGRHFLIVLIGVAAGLIGVSRVAVGAHYPSDVLAGCFVGFSFTIAYAYALGRHGVAFQRQPDGSLMPKTMAVQNLTRTMGPKGAIKALLPAYHRGD